MSILVKTVAGSHLFGTDTLVFNNLLYSIFI